MTAVLTAEPIVGAAYANASSIKVRKSGVGNVKEVKLGLNKAVVVDLPEDAQDILVANPEVADAVTRSARRIYLFGKKVGQTNIFVFGHNGKQIVSLDLAVERDITGLQRQLSRFIPDSDITVEIISDNIVLTGTVRTPQDASRASQLAEIFLKGGEATTRNITAVGDGGDAAIFAEQRQVSQIINLIDIEGEDQVTLKVTVAEVSRQVLKQLGFSTSVIGASGNPVFQSVNPAGLGKALSSSAGLSQFNLGDYTIRAYVRAMEQAGVMKTLAEPTLTAVSGEPATFFVGGEFQLVAGQSFDDNGTVTYSFQQREWGIGLEFIPVVLSAGRISLRVKTEVSEPTFEGSVSLNGGLASNGGITANGIRRREADTAVELPSGGSIVVAGLVRDEMRQVMGGFPGLSKVPVLGTLFRSRDFVRNETELVIIATPYLVRPVARNKLARPDDNFNASSDGAANFLGRVNRVYGQMETDLPPGRYHGVVGFIYK